MIFVKCFISVLLISFPARGEDDVSTGNEVVDKTGNDLFSGVARKCLFEGNEPVMTCLRQNVLSYLNGLLGVRDEFGGKGSSDRKMDAAIVRKLNGFLNSHEFTIHLPAFLFDDAILTFNPSKGIADFKVDFPEVGRTEEGARGHLKKKLFFPLLLLLKLKLKALTPILLALVGIKAVKAFVMSKISILLVVGFLLFQLFKKKGMTMAMTPTAASTTDPTPVYGLPQSAATYGPPAPAPDASYGSWEPSSDAGNGGSYPHRWDSHSIAYNAHVPEDSTKATDAKGI